MTMFVPKQNLDSQIIHVYSDGGCRSTAKKGETIKKTDKCAYAYFLKYGGSEKLQGEAGYGMTNNAMEIKGLLEALKAIKTDHIPIKAYLDSAYVVNTIEKKWYVKWRRDGWTKKGGLANAELWKELIEQIERFPFFEIQKVKGHANDLYNNLVDDHLNELMDKLPPADIERILEDEAIEQIAKEKNEGKFVESNENKQFVIDKLNKVIKEGVFIISSPCVDDLKELIAMIENDKIKIG